MNDSAGVRRLNLITGPSGAGKSVFCKRQPDWDHCLLNLDDFARLLGDADDLDNRQKAWTALLSILGKRMEQAAAIICIDSVFGQREYEDVMEVLENSPHSYEIALWVISPADPTTCAERIVQRKHTGGHGRPELAAALFEDALTAASTFSLNTDHTFLIDSRAGLNMVGYLRQYQLHPLDDIEQLPAWVTDHFPVYPADQEPAQAPAGDQARAAVATGQPEPG